MNEIAPIHFNLCYVLTRLETLLKWALLIKFQSEKNLKKQKAKIFLLLPQVISDFILLISILSFAWSNKNFSNLRVDEFKDFYCSAISYQKNSLSIGFVIMRVFMLLLMREELQCISSIFIRSFSLFSK